MAIKVVMPQLGESVVEGTLTKWLKSPGDPVEEFEPLVEVNTDKVDTEVPSPAAGVLLNILVAEGTTVQAGTLMAWIGEPGEKPGEAGMAATSAAGRQSGDVLAAAPPAPATPPVAEPVAAYSSGRDRQLGFISPVVARMASEQGIDLHMVQGSGRDGRITKKDIELYLTRMQEILPDEAATRLQPAGSSELPSPAGAPGSTASAPPPGGEPGELIPHSTLRRQIAEHMLRSKHTSPHVTTIMEADLKRVVAHRQANKESFARQGVNLTFSAYFIAAAVEALKAFPIVNSSWSEEGLRLHQSINVGMATSLGEGGLIVPVLKKAESLSLLGIARAVNDLANRSRARQLVPDEVQGGTFTITNHGVSGSLFATPIINQPQCAILGVGAIQKRPVVISDETLGDVIAIRTMVYLGLTFDHRVLDGASADNFLARVVQVLQDWS
jgi:2-oxoglutarate dehydrogenase E2 component (dihydrolipoamide succinyltransferase)